MSKFNVGDKVYFKEATIAVLNGQIATVKNVSAHGEWPITVSVDNVPEVCINYTACGHRVELGDKDTIQHLTSLHKFLAGVK